MKKPSNYEATQAGGDFTPIELGGHILIIKQVEEMKSRTGKDMLKVSFDTSDKDLQPHYFADLFKGDIRPDKKWPANGTTYILTEDQEGNCSRQFKTFTTSIEKSNNGFSISWGDGFAACLKNKEVGGVFGEVEEEYEGRVSMRRKLRWFRSSEGVLEVDVPDEKYLKGKAASKEDANGFVSIPEGIDEELPF